MAKSREVDAWMRVYDNPMKPVVQRVREILLGADPRIGECIKWKTPTFTFEGNLASFNPRAKKHASLMFHTGAEIPGKHPILKGAGTVARYVDVATVEEADAMKKQLEAIVRAWIASKASEPPKAAAKKKATKKKAPKKKAPKKKAPKMKGPPEESPKKRPAK
jgi:hypothetical protein